MLQYKFLLFSAVCCCLLQVICGQPGAPRLPPSALFRPKFLRSSTSFSTSTSSEQPVQPLENQNAQSASAETETSAIKQQDTAVIPTSQEVTPSEESEEPSENGLTEETFDEEIDNSKKNPQKKKLSRTKSRNNSTSKDPLDIANVSELKERAKDLIRGVLKNQNANRAITLLAINARNLLENKIASNIILTHTRFIKDTLTNEEAKQVFKDIRFELYKTFVNAETAQKVQAALQKSKDFLSSETLPGTIRKRFKILKKLIKKGKLYPALESAKDSLIHFVKTNDVRTEIAKGFKLLDFGIHFDPNNIMKSLGLSLFKR